MLGDTRAYLGSIECLAKCTLSRKQCPLPGVCRTTSMPPSLSLPPYSPQIRKRTTRAVIQFDVPTGASDPTAPTVLVTIASGRGKAGNQSIRVARQISQGVRRAGLPVETTGFHATINLKMAQAIGLTVPKDLLGGVDTITRRTSVPATDTEGGDHLRSPGWSERYL
jgi:hypothetical protein